MEYWAVYFMGMATGAWLALGVAIFTHEEKKKKK